MKRAAIVVALLAPACAGRAGPSAPVEPDREAVIYAAIIRRLVTVDHTFGGDPGFGAGYVLDRALPRAAEGIVTGEGTPIEARVQAEIREAPADLPPIRFVSDRDQVVGPMEEGGVVKNDRRPGHPGDDPRG